MSHVFKAVATPVGKLTLIASEKGLAAILWENDKETRVPIKVETEENPNHPILLKAEQQLKEYFCGKRKSFSIELDLQGTEFQKQVWQELLSIPFGETRSYGQIAQNIHRPKASRAVGAANGRNPVSIVVPCHRVIGENGKLTGFAGGLEAKSKLLMLERAGREPITECSKI